MIQKIFMAVFLFLLIIPVRVISAPTGDIGNPFLWKKGLYTGSDDKGYTLALEYYFQSNEFLRQRDREPVYIPNQYPPEERHKEVARYSQNKFSFSGLMAGMALNKAYHVYMSLGLVDSEIKLDYHNEMVIDSTGGFYAAKEKFSSDSDLYYGVGVSAVIHEAEFRGSPIKAGLDLKYKRFSMEDDRLSTQGRSYECTLEELQLSLNISAIFKQLSFYGGVKVSSYAGDEKFTDIDADKYFNSNINYDHSIERQTYLGALFGITIPVKDWCAVTIETHIADEEGYVLSCMTKF